MKRNLLLLSCLLGFSLMVFAQKKREKKEDYNRLTVPGSAALRPSANAAEVKFDYKLPNAPLPKFDIYNLNNVNITKDVLESGGNIFVMIFNPVCEHCESQTLSFIQNRDLFKKSKILLVAAPIQVPNIPFFEANLKFSQYQDLMTVSVDSARILDKIFNYVELPQINIYDGKTSRLLKTFNSIQPIDSFRKYIQ